jgi:DNA repair protein RadD
MIEPRPYQELGFAELRARIGRGKRRVLLVGPTGMGKTVLAVMVLMGALARGSRVLFLAHRRELIYQPFARLVRAGVLYDQIGIVMAGVPNAHASVLPFDLGAAKDIELWKALARRRPTAPIQIGSVDTVRARGVAPPADIVFVDEAHRSLSNTHRNIIAQYPNAVVVGLTATPVRADGQPLGDVFDDMIVVSSYRELAEQGYLVTPRVFTVPSADLPDLGHIKIAKSGLNKGDYDHAELVAAVDQTGLVGDLVEHYKTHGNGAPAIAFAVSRDHSRHVAERFTAAGIPALHVDGETDPKERDEAVEKLRDGRVKLLSNVDVFTEGTDVPCVKVIILARPTKSLRVYMQQVGRGSRPSGNLPFIVLDHAGCALEHGLPQDDREWSLTADRKKAKKKTTSSTTCPCCYAVLPSGAKVCKTEQPEGKPCMCGSVCEFRFGVETGGDKSVPEEHDGKLIEVRPADQEEKREYWNQLCHTAVERGYKPGWAKYRYKEKFGVWPPNTFGVPHIERPHYTEEQKREELRRLVQLGRDRGYDAAWAFIRYQAKFGESAPLEQVSAAAQEEVRWAI